MIIIKEKKKYQEKVEWHVNRLLSKLNYVVHIDAVKNYIVSTLTEEQKIFDHILNIIYYPICNIN